MVFATAGQLVRAAPTATPEDPIGLVAENLRQSPYGAIAVLDRILPGDGEGGWSTLGAHIVGLIEEKDLSRATLPVLATALPRPVAVLPGEPDAAGSPFSTELNGGALNGHPGPQIDTFDIPSITAKELMRRDFGIVPSAFSLQNALLTLDRYEANALPVLDADGTFRGMIARSDVVAALGEYVRPPVVGGMATPLGVWLTDGKLQGGAPPIGLFLSGLALTGCSFVAQVIMLVILSQIKPEYGAMFFSGRLGFASDNSNLFNLAVTAVQGVLFLGTLRLTPIAGIHAAEHQTVWALERGIALTPENVAKMPRAHPRCGTNIMAVSILLMTMLQHAPSYDSGYVMMSLIFTVLFWRQFGTFLQNFFTTRPASRRELESGIKAGKEIMAKYQSQPHVMPSFALRLLNSGLVLCGAGAILGVYVFDKLFTLVSQAILK